MSEEDKDKAEGSAEREETGETKSPKEEVQTGPVSESTASEEAPAEAEAGGAQAAGDAEEPEAAPADDASSEAAATSENENEDNAPQEGEAPGEEEQPELEAPAEASPESEVAPGTEGAADSDIAEPEAAADLDDADEEPEEYDDEDVNSLDYVLRSSSLRYRIISGLKATPWWMVSVALHAVAGLVLAQLVYQSARKKVDDVIIETQIIEDNQQPLDLEKIKEALKEFDQDVKTEKLVHAPSLVNTPSILPEAPPDIETAGLGEGEDAGDVGDESFMGLDEGLGGEGEGIGEVEKNPLAGVGKGRDFNVRGVDSYGKIMDDLSVKLGKTAKRRHRGNVFLIWVIDSSLGMQDDQTEIKERLWEMDKKFRDQQGDKGELLQAVVHFSDKPTLWLKPTTDVNKVIKAVSHIPLSQPGTSENVMAALSYAATALGAKAPAKYKKVAVLIDDDNADDTKRTESTLALLRKAKMTLYAINRECPFQSNTLRESFKYTDPDTGQQYSGTGTVLRGPETAELEVPNTSWGEFFPGGNWNGGISNGGKIRSGYGIYDVSRIAYYTGGSYYILDPNPEEDKSKEYNWELMEVYRPELVSRAAYKKRTARNPFKAAIESINRRLVAQMPNRGAWWWWKDIQTLRRQLEAKLKQMDGFIREMKHKAIIPTSRLEKLKQNRRWPADADIYYAQLTLTRYRLRQLKYGMDEFLRTTKSVKKDYIIYRGPYQKPKLTKDEAKDRAAVVAAVEAVKNRHPDTPWAMVASKFNPKSNKALYGFKFFTRYRFPPFWAAIVLNNGQKFEAWVYSEDKKKGTYTVRLPRKGSRVINKKDIKRMTKSKNQNKRLDWYPRI